LAERILGMMVGTSLDGIDAAVVEFDREGRARLLGFGTSEFASVDPDRLRGVASGEPVTAGELSALGFSLARDHARAVQDVDPRRTADLIGAHGVTVSHVPGGDPPHGWQLLNGAALAALTGRSVACDFRAADIALGGQGAPLAPVADLALRVAPDEDRIILNLGGISNFTALPAGATSSGELIAGDAGPANLVLDGFIRRVTAGREDFDADGALAMQGTPAPDVVEAMLRDPWFSRPLPRSAGREEFGEAWLDRFGEAAAALGSDADRMATLVGICARAVADQVQGFPAGWRRAARSRVLVTGGGRMNRALMAALAEVLAGFEVEPIEAIGENGDAKEAVDFAWLARQRRNGVPLDLAPLTGASANMVAGALHSGPEPTA
jgi:anhydro-N-acetylmuramic acid kinase